MTETKHPENTGNKGFIPLSRNAYKQLYRMYGKHPASETEAYCILIANVNYHDSSMTLYGNPVACPCGDSIKSLDTWARLFRWNRSRVRRFFLSLQKLELIEYSIDHSLAHVHVVDFLPAVPTQTTAGTNCSTASGRATTTSPSCPSGA